MATITTVIPVYNGERHIRATLESLAAQTRRPDRVIAVDDGSRDGTEEIVRSFRGIICEWAPNPRNLGLFPNHNSALRFANETKFIHILHANDVVSPMFFEKLVPLIENAPGNALAFSGHVFIREDDSETRQKWSIRASAPRQLSTREFLGMQTELKPIQVHSAVMKTDFKPMPNLFRTDLPQTADIVFHSQFASHCSQIWAHPEILAQVRIHEESASSKNIRNLDAWVLGEWKAMQLAYDVMREKGLGSWAHAEKLKLLFAARSHVKIKMMRTVDPAYASEIRAIAEAKSGPVHWAAARAVVAFRDALFPKADASNERLAHKAI
jgi:glycosyltransferase involved in cell wall biosynthesis